MIFLANLNDVLEWQVLFASKHYSNKIKYILNVFRLHYLYQQVFTLKPRNKLYINVTAPIPIKHLSDSTRFDWAHSSWTK